MKHEKFGGLVWFGSACDFIETRQKNGTQEEKKNISFLINSQLRFQSRANDKCSRTNVVFYLNWLSTVYCTHKNWLIAPVLCNCKCTYSMHDTIFTHASYTNDMNLKYNLKFIWHNGALTNREPNNDDIWICMYSKFVVSQRRKTPIPKWNTDKM